MIGQKAADLIHPDDVRSVRAKLKQIKAGNITDHTLRLRYLHKDGRWIWTEVAFQITRDDHTGNPTGYIASLRDITQRHEAELRANHLARHDALTSLPNRILFQEYLPAKLTAIREEGGHCALLYGDLDRFKFVNDTLGHTVGDLVLKIVAERLTGALGSNVFVARFGGDEFVIILTGKDAEPASCDALALLAIQVVSEPIQVERRHVNIGITFGLSRAPDDGVTADDLLRNADLALFRAKAEKPGTFLAYDPSMCNAAAEQQRLELDLRQALARNEFELNYQPVIALADGRPSGAEALLRWRHPERGVISPTVFIPMAENLGIIDQIGAWTLQQACRDAAGWPQHLKVAVNVSARQFEKAGLIDIVLRALAGSGLRPERLELEVTETTLMREELRVAETLAQLRALGVRIALDDFGTGYSSLSYLRRFEFDKLKLDRSFAADLNNNSMRCIIRAVMAMSEGLGLTVTAEGIESVEQLEAMRAEGCAEIQGYYFSRALPLAEFIDFVQHESAKARVA